MNTFNYMFFVFVQNLQNIPTMFKNISISMPTIH